MACWYIYYCVFYCILQKYLLGLVKGATSLEKEQKRYFHLTLVLTSGYGS